MTNKKKILFIDREQFGYLTDSLKYCEYLNESYQIEYLCFDKKRPQISVPNIKMIYVPYTGPKAYRGIRLILTSIRKCFFYKGFIFVLFFPKCKIIKQILFWKKMHIDVRTLSVISNEKERREKNNKIFDTVNSFNSASFITSRIRDEVPLKSTIKSYILPLGADIISNTYKDFTHLKMLYIGTLNNRDMIKTVIGLECFRNTHPDIPIEYNIIGEGDDYPIIEEYIKTKRLEDIIHLLGRKCYTELKYFLDTHTIGVSFIPMTKGYDLQPPTKSYEYILSGLFCIATATFTNRKIITDKNGILIKDTTEDFAEAIWETYQRRQNLDSEEIRLTLKQYHWKTLVEQYFKPIIEQ